MNGNLKVLQVSHAKFLLKEKRMYKNVNIHFRDNDSHTLKLSNGKEATLKFNAMTIEAKSLFLEADGWIAEETPTMLQLRFYPQIEAASRRAGNTL